MERSVYSNNLHKCDSNNDLVRGFGQIDHVSSLIQKILCVTGIRLELAKPIMRNTFIFNHCTVHI